MEKEELKKVLLNLPDALYTKIKVEAVKRGVTISEFVAALLKSGLKK